MRTNPGPNGDSYEYRLVDDGDGCAVAYRLIGTAIKRDRVGHLATAPSRARWIISSDGPSLPTALRDVAEVRAHMGLHELRQPAAVVPNEIGAVRKLLSRRCKGHPAGPHDLAGQTIYCDGSCAPRVAP